MNRSVATGCVLIICGGQAAAVLAAARVQGRLTSDGVTGRTVTGHGWVDNHIFLSGPGPGLTRG